MLSKTGWAEVHPERQLRWALRTSLLYCSLMTKSKWPLYVRVTEKKVPPPETSLQHLPSSHCDLHMFCRTGRINTKPLSLEPQA